MTTNTREDAMTTPAANHCETCQEYHDRYICAYPDRARVIGQEWDEHRTTHPKPVKFYLIELRDSDGNDCSVSDLLIAALDRDSAYAQADAYIVEAWPDDESDGGFGTFHPCDCWCDHFVGNGVPGKQVGVCDDCQDGWECSHGGVLLSEEPEEYATEAEARDYHKRELYYHSLVDLT